MTKKQSTYRKSSAWDLGIAKLDSSVDCLCVIETIVVKIQGWWEAEVVISYPDDLDHCHSYTGKKARTLTHALTKALDKAQHEEQKRKNRLTSMANS